MKKVLYQIGNRRAVLMNERVAQFLASRGRGVYFTEDVKEDEVVTAALASETEVAEVAEETPAPARRRRRRRSSEAEAE